MVPDAYTTTDLPDDAVSAGQIQDQEAVTQALGDMAAQFDLSFAHVAVSENQAYMFMATLPPVDKADIHETVALRISEQVPVDKNQAVFDYEIRNQLPDGRWQVAVTAIEKEKLTPTLSAFSAVDISVTSIELTAQAVARTWANDTASTKLLVYIDNRETVLAIVDGGVVAHMTAVDCGTDDLAGVGPKDLSEYLFTTGFTRNEQTADTYRKLSEAIQPIITASRKRMRFWKTEAKNRSSDIASVVVAGPGAQIPHISAELGSALGSVSERLNPFAGAFSPDAYIPELSMSEAFPYQVAIGLAVNPSN